MTNEEGNVTETKPHVLVVSVGEDQCPGLSDEHTKHDDNCLDYEIECPGVADGCRAWVECKPCNALDDDEDLVTDSEAHGQRHKYLPDLRWCVPTSDCYASLADNLPDAAERLRLAPGRYEVGVDFDESVYLELDLLGQPEVAVR